MRILWSMHAICFHSADWLDLFGSLGALSLASAESLHFKLTIEA